MPSARLLELDGVTFAFDDVAPFPAALVAYTLHAYCVPFVNELTRIGLDVPVAVRAVPPVTEQVAVYPVIADPPSLAGAVNATLAVPLPGDTVPIVGAPGTVRGVTDTVPDAAPVPAAFVAVTEQVYAVPFVRPDTVIGLAVPVPVIVAPEAVQDAV